MAVRKKPLEKRKCRGCEGKTGPLDAKAIQRMLREIPDWTLFDGRLRRKFEFVNFHQTMEFVNAIAWLSNLENHHPDLHVSYSACVVDFITHSVAGLTENDFIVAAKIDALLKL